MRTHPAVTLFFFAGAAMLAMGPVRATPTDEIRVTLRKFVAAQNAHDLKRVDRLLSDSRDFLWVGPGSAVRTRDGALRRFAELFKTNWRVDPDWPTFQVLMLDVSTAEIFVKVSITEVALSRSTDMNQILVNTPNGWRVLTILMGKAP